jgi:peptidylprolyl isomerase
VDLVERGFYNGLEFIRAEDFYVLQVGDPPGKEEGFVDPATGEYRAIPLEVLVRGDSEPVYGITLEDAGRYRDQPVLPFSAYGTVAMARPGDDPNGASSQFFFFLFEPELTPAGLNLLDGRYSVFGYLIEGKEVLEKLKEGDVIQSAQVVKGAENLVTSQVAEGSSGQKPTPTKRDEIESVKVVEAAENLVDSQVTEAIAETEAIITPNSQPAILDTPTS